jgi:hypothetical protein
MHFPRLRCDSQSSGRYSLAHWTCPREALACLTRAVVGLDLALLIGSGGHSCENCGALPLPLVASSNVLLDLWKAWV